MSLKKISILLGVILSLIMIVTYGVKLDGRWAKAGDIQVVQQNVEQVSMRLEQKIQDDKIYNLKRSKFDLQRRIWALNDQFKNMDMPQAVKDVYRELKLELEQIKKDLEIK